MSDRRDRADEGGPADAGDDLLLAEVRDALADPDPIPAGLAAGARDAFDWRRIDAVLAELSAEESLAGVRSGSDAGLTFSATSRTVEIDAHRSGGGVILTGQVLPAAPGEVRWESPSGPSEPIPVDELGTFELRDAPPGPLRVVIDFEDGSRLLTDWVVA